MDDDRFSSLQRNTNDSEDSDGIVFEILEKTSSNKKSESLNKISNVKLKENKKKLIQNLSIQNSEMKSRSKRLIQRLKFISRGEISSSAKKFLLSKMYPSEFSLSSLSKNSMNDQSASFHRSHSMNDALMLYKGGRSNSFGTSFARSASTPFGVCKVYL